MELNRAIEKVADFINESDPKSEECIKAIRSLKELLDLKERLNPKPQVIEVVKPEVKKRISPETIEVLKIVVPAITSLVGILIIIKYEEMNILTSKALGFIGRFR